MAGLVLVIFSAGGGTWLMTSSEFRLEPGGAQIDGLGYTDRAAVLAAVKLSDEARPDVVLLNTAAMRSALAALPAVADAQVSVELPHALHITIEERHPVLALHRPDGSFVIDADGVVVASVDPAQLDVLGLPRIDDQRQSYVAPVTLGQPLDQVDLSAMLQLGALTPALLGSTATTLNLRVEDDAGFVLTAEPFGWRAIFGSYTPTLRPPDMIARQVECLRSLLGQGEADIATIYLAPLDDRCGTFMPRETPRTSPSPEPSA